MAVKKDGTLLVIESKGTLSTNRPLTLAKVTSKVQRKKYVQPSRAWLTPNANKRYLNKLVDSIDADDVLAARLLQRVIDGDDVFDAAIVHVRPAAGKAFGGGIDTSARLIREGGKTRRLDIVDVPFG